jgi:hypothetical protein
LFSFSDLVVFWFSFVLFSFVLILSVSDLLCSDPPVSSLSFFSDPLSILEGLPPLDDPLAGIRGYYNVAAADAYQL